MSSPTRRNRWVLAIPLTILALGVATAWWIVTPAAFPDADGTVGVVDPDEGQVWLLGLPVPTAQVTVSSARPTLVEGGVAASVVVCEGDDRVIDGLVKGTAAELCDEVLEVGGAVLGPQTPERFLALELRVTGSTPASVSGVAVAYTQGYRFGRQEVARALEFSRDGG